MTAPRLLSASLAVGLVAAACGGSADISTNGSNDSSAENANPASSTPTADESTDDGVAADEAPAPAGTTGEAEETAAPAENLFPDVDVVNVVDGSTVNLTSLGGGDLPVLLWFWAPH